MGPNLPESTAVLLGWAAFVASRDIADPRPPVPPLLILGTPPCDQTRVDRNGRVKRLLSIITQRARLLTEQVLELGVKALLFVMRFVILFLLETAGPLSLINASLVI